MIAAPEHFQSESVRFARVLTQARTRAPVSCAAGVKVAVRAPAIVAHLVTGLFLTVTVFSACHSNSYAVPFGAGCAIAAVRVLPTCEVPVIAGARSAGAACRVAASARIVIGAATSSIGSRGTELPITAYVTPFSAASCRLVVVESPA